jgi:SAM-dependent methyltransferase
MNNKERLLLFFCRSIEEAEQLLKMPAWDENNALSMVTQIFPEFLNKVKEKRILDYGCGKGWQCVMLAKKGAKYVVGFDNNLFFLKNGKNLAKQACVSSKTEFVNRLDQNSFKKFDIVLSLNSMEHFSSPSKVLKEMKRVICDNGKIYLTFGPPWYAPYGSHMNYFTWLPWVNLLFSEETVMKVRSRYRKDGSKRYVDVPGGLNKMSAEKCEKLISEAGLKIVFRKYDCIRRLNFLAIVPFIRELFINRMSYVLDKTIK